MSPARRGAARGGSGPKRRFVGMLLSLALVRRDVAQPRLVCIVPKKLFRSAVERNAMKRRCREAMRPILSAAAGWSVLVYPKYSALHAPISALAQESEALLEQAIEDIRE